MTRGAAIAATLLVAGCAVAPPHPGSFRFAVFGDMPYRENEEAAFDAIIEAMGREELAFVVNVGDFKSGSSPCADALYANRKARFARSRHPLAYTPGDNEWVDCRRKSAGARDPLERLARLREVFFAEPRFLGPADAPAQEVMDECAAREAGACRCPALPENRRWAQPIAGLGQSVVFVTLNVQGSNDNVGFDAASDREAACRSLANRRWLESAFARARDGAAAVVVAFQANPFMPSLEGVFDPLREALVRESQRFGRPVLVIHGDTHTYAVDQPFRDAHGNLIENLTRLETFGSPRIGWVLVTVDPSDPAFFRFEPRR